MNDYKHLYKVALVEYAKFSTCDRLKVAALLVHDGRILSCGYNGVPSGDQHCCDKFSHDNHGNFYIDGEPVSEEVYRFKHHEFSEVDEVHAEVVQCRLRVVFLDWQNAGEIGSCKDGV